jgi:tRNA(Ile)-lysidine synthase TilS/MesJ
MTAHHQDDLIETSLLNLARGSGRLGLAPMTAVSDHLLRPLLAVPRAGLRDYAAARHLAWREDPTNQDLNNPRNWLRHRLLPVAPPGWREAYLRHIAALAALNTTIGASLKSLLTSARTDDATFSFSRADFRNFSPAEAADIILAAARALRPGLQVDRPALSQAVNLAFTGRTGTRRPLRREVVLMLTQSHILVTTKMR